jgi:hypothetical protein
MSIGIVIYRSSPISLNEWKAIVSSDSGLRLKAAPYSAPNPESGELLAVSAGEADAEIQDTGGEWLPFLRWRRGSLTTAYEPEFEVPSNPVRLKLVHVAKQLHAVLGTDASDEALEW